MKLKTAERIIVGVNKFTQEQEGITRNVFTIDESIRTIQTDKIKELKAERNNDAVNMALKNLEKQQKADQNLMPYFIAVELSATERNADTLRIWANISRLVYR